MAFRYEPCPAAGSLRQGELIGPLWEHRSLLPPTELDEGHEVPTASVRHELAVVMTPDCDLLWDFAARFKSEDAQTALDPEDPAIETAAVAVPHVLLCEAYAEEDARGRVAESRLWKLLQQNRDERYHHYAESEVGDTGERIADVYIDFKKILAVPTTQLYAGVRSGEVARRARVPPVYRHDLIHRFYGYLSRVAVPADA